MTQTPPPPAPGQIQLRLEVPADLRAEYCNLISIFSSASDFSFDFIHVLTAANNARVQSRIVMSPTAAKALLRTLQEHIGKYEERYGEIKGSAAPTLADKLFGGVKPGSEDPAP
jgi:hypothetical protein